MNTEPIKIERTYEDGSKDFIEGEMLKNYLDNIKVADSFAVSRSYIQYKPVVWQVLRQPEKNRD